MRNVKIFRCPMFSMFTKDDGSYTVHEHNGHIKRPNTYGRPFKKASRLGKKISLNRCGHRSNPRPK